MKLYQAFAAAFTARFNCINSGNEEWIGRWEDRIAYMNKEFMPSGSGFDAGTEYDIDESDGDRLTFLTSFHHMDENGSYDGWSAHQIVVKPSLQFGFLLDIIGEDRDGIQDYIADVFHHALSLDVEWNADDTVSLSSKGDSESS